MRVVSLDSETFLIRPGCQTPRLVCVTTFDNDGTGTQRDLLNAKDGVEMTRRLLSNPDITLVGHFIQYDMGVLAAEDPTLLPLIFQALQDGRIRCTKIRQMMIDNATGELKFIENEDGELKAQDYSLQRLVYRHTKRYAPKGKSCGDCVGGHKPDCFAPLCLGCCAAGCEASFRLRYGLLVDIPVADWPEPARKYAQDDAEDTYEVFMAQERLVADGEQLRSEPIPGEKRQTQAAWALYLTSIWGMKTDPKAVAALRVSLQAEKTELQQSLVAAGLVRSDEKTSKDMKAIYARVTAAFTDRGLQVPQTDGGRVATDRHTLKASGDEVLATVAEYTHVGKLLTTYVPVLEGGTEYPIQCKYNPILETFRTSSASPNMQNPPRKGGVRNCFRSRAGSVFVTCDYSTLEMRTLAQVYYDFFGVSPLRDALNAGQDVHVALAAEIVGKPYEDVAARIKAGETEMIEARQSAKVGNFAFPGGMGAVAFLSFALQSYGTKISSEQAKTILAGFKKRWGMDRYFELCGGLAEHGNAEKIVFPRSGHVRGDVKYTAICNGFFQELAALGAKEALWEVVRECYLESPTGVGPTPLYGCRPVLFMHDEIMLEVRRDPRSLESRRAASAAGARLSEVMVATMQKRCPDVTIAAQAVMMPIWHKGAEPQLDADGLLAPVRPVESVGADGKKKVTWEVMTAEELEAM